MMTSVIHILPAARKQLLRCGGAVDLLPSDEKDNWRQQSDFFGANLRTLLTFLKFISPSSGHYKRHHRGDIVFTTANVHIACFFSIIGEWRFLFHAERVFGCLLHQSVGNGLRVSHALCKEVREYMSLFTQKYPNEQYPRDMTRSYRHSIRSRDLRGRQFLRPTCYRIVHLYRSQQCPPVLA